MARDWQRDGKRLTERWQKMTERWREIDRKMARY